MFWVNEHESKLIGCNFDLMMHQSFPKKHICKEMKGLHQIGELVIMLLIDVRKYQS